MSDSQQIILLLFLGLVFLTVRSRRACCDAINTRLYGAQVEVSGNATSTPKQELGRHASISSKRITQRLQIVVGECVLLPSSSAYTISVKDYFAQQSTTTKPCCVVQPTTVQQVSKSMAILYEEFHLRTRSRDDANQPSRFVAIRSGGHSYARASASVDGGVLIDLSLLSDVRLADDRTSVTIGTGARWSKVYELLEANKLAVPGGRNATVGVGGFTLGGESCCSLSCLVY